LNCHETKRLLHGYVDGELDLLKNLEIEQHVQDCAACAQALAGIQAVRTAVKEGSPYFTPPPGLQERLQASLRKAGGAAPATHWHPRRWLAVAASVAVAALALGMLGRLWTTRSAAEVLSRELIASHIRSQMLPDRLVDVWSSDQHRVKPWFEGKINFSPPVPDLQDQGYSLIGGRLDYADNRPVAALVYGRREHKINLFIWPAAAGGGAPPPAVTRQGYHLVSWKQGDMMYAAVSNLNEEELGEFVRLIQARTPGPANAAAGAGPAP
jgi:anti-sigma factor RsiW